MEQATFDDWVRAAAPRLHRTAFVLTGDWSLAQDLVQQACAATWSKYGKIHNPDAFAQKVMARTAAAWWRRKWHSEVPHADVPDRAGEDPWTAVAGAAGLRAALMRLPVRQRSVLVLRFLGDLSEAETAAALGWPVGTVKSTTARALAALRATGLVESEARQ